MFRLVPSARAAASLASSSRASLSRQTSLPLTSGSRCTSRAFSAATPPPDHAAAQSSRDQPGGRSSHQGAPTPPPARPPRPSLDASPTALWVGRLIGVGLGLYGAVQVAQFLRRKQHKQDAEQAQEAADKQQSSGSKGRGRPGEPSIRIPPMDYHAHSMSEIFQSVLDPLTHFDQVADEFVDRKAASADRVALIAANRKKGPVDSADARQAEVEATRIAAEERTVLQPRLAYLRELYRVRSLELMQRSQYNGERMVEAGKDGSAEEAARVKEEVKAEQAAFQELSRKSQHLANIVQKYDLKSDSLAARRMMRPTTEGIPPPDEDAASSK